MTAVKALPLPRGLDGALQSLPPHVAREIRGYFQEHARAARALATAPLQRRIAELETELSALKQQREGWVMVPKEPTQAMKDAAFFAWYGSELHELESLAFKEELAEIYTVMLAAAPPVHSKEST